MTCEFHHRSEVLCCRALWLATCVAAGGSEPCRVRPADEDLSGCPAQVDGRSSRGWLQLDDVCHPAVVVAVVAVVVDLAAPRIALLDPPTATVTPYN